MKTKYLFIFFTISGLIVLFTGLFLYLSEQSFWNKKETIYFAMAGPMTGNSSIHGKQMLNGINLFMDDFNKTNDKYKIEMIVFDDKNDKRIAIKTASKIVSNEDILIVIGHYASDTSASAGEVYKRTGMPVITASATANIVTFNNDWYFRTVVDNNFVGKFLAFYIKIVLKMNSAIIIFDKDYYGTSLLKGFEEAAPALDLLIQKKWGLDTENKQIENRLKKINNLIRSIYNLGAIFLALHGEESAKVIASLQYPGTNYSFVGADSLNSESFQHYSKKYPMGKSFSGYNSNHIYAISHFLNDLSGEKGLKFKNKFIEKYSREPSWVSSTYYDTMNIVTKAIERAEIHDIKNIRERRKLLRNALARINSPESAITGVCGKTFFDTNGNVNKSPSMGIFQNYRLMPYYYQYIIAPETHENINSNEKENQNIIKIDETYLKQSNVVYTGIDINQISFSELNTSNCNIDFFIWFRFANTLFNDKEITFTNAVAPVLLGQPVLESHMKDYIVRTYRVKADFQIDYDFHKFPFEQLKINIRLRHQTIPESKLVYIPDYSGMPDHNSLKKLFFLNTKEKMNFVDVRYYQNNLRKSCDKTKKSGSYRNIADYSQFNAVYTLERKSTVMMLKHFLPVFSALILLYFSFFIPATCHYVQFILIAAATFTCALYHAFLNYTLKVDYILYIEYAFWCGYLLFAITFLLFIKSKQLQNKKAYDSLRRLNNYLKMSYKLLVIFITISLVYLIIFYKC
jgi:branched-chain amino acid transport system substrate-binding protein